MSRKGKDVDRADRPVDPRFSRLSTDRRFLKPPRQKHKVVVDERFKGLFDEEKQRGPRVDKYGRRIGKDKSRDELRRFYRLDAEHSAGPAAKPGQPAFVDYARGEAVVESSSSEEESGGEEASDVTTDDDDHVELGYRPRRASSEIDIDLNEDDLPDLDDAEERDVAVEDETRRLAIINLDWDHVRAIDLYKVFASVLSPNAPDASRLPPPPALGSDLALHSKRSGPRIAKGRVISVSIYPSEFGKGRLEQENREGPPAAIFKAFDDREATDGERGDEEPAIDERAVVREDDGAEYDEIALRRYQLERLRYYFAIAEFDTVSAARHAFDEIDGSEFERTANTLTLRSVPDDMLFEDEAKDTATQDAVNYKAADFVTDALRHSRVKLTWDADDPQRSKITRRDMSKLPKGDLETLDVAAYLATDSDASESEDDKRATLRAALGLNGEDAGATDGRRKPAGDMQITFAPAFTEPRAANTQDETTLNIYQRKERERRARKKAERVAKQSNAPDDEVAAAPDATRIGGESEPDNDRAADGDVGFDDPFFASDSDAEANAFQNRSERPEKSRTTAQGDIGAARDDAEAARSRAELSLLVDSDSDEGVEGKHFDMRAIMKAEKASKGKRKRKRPAKNGATADIVPDTFQVDVADSRFRALHDDHRFAIDPTNPRYQKTRNTDKLLEESRRRRRARLTESSAKHQEASATGDADSGLASLVARVKNRSALHAQGTGKRQKRA